MADSSSIAATVLGLIGTILWCIQLIPQIWSNHRSKQTEGLPAAMLLLWAISGVPFGVYATLRAFPLPLQIQPPCFAFLSLIAYCQVLHYSSRYTVARALLVFAGLLLVFAGVEAALIMTLRPWADGYPVTVIGVVAAVLLAAGLVPPYLELAKRSGKVVGINFVFLGMDAAGAGFSLVALLVRREFDLMGGVLYIVCLVLELGIFASHGVWWVRTRAERKGEMGDEELAVEDKKILGQETVMVKETKK